MKKINLKSLNYVRFRFIIRGALVGILVGFVVSLFRLVIENLLKVMQGVYPKLLTEPKFWPIVILFLIFVLGVNAHFLAKEPNISGSGIPQVEGQLAGLVEVDWWSVLWRKWIGGVLAIGSGLFLGREGPSIQLGAMVGQGVSQKLHLNKSEQRCLLAGGAAAGLAAAFNAPIAASLFVIEEIYHNFSPFVWTTSLAAAVTANFVSLNFFGLRPVLYLPHDQSFPPSSYWALVILGIFLGLLGLVYEFLTLNSSYLYQKLKWLPPRFYGAIPLAIVIFIGMYWPQYLGGGNNLIVSLPAWHLTLGSLLCLFLLRLVFSTLSYGSSLPGGIFLPILTLGALLGALYWKVLAQMGLLSDAFLVNCMIYAMAGYFAGIGKAPFTAILLVTEMVGSLEHLMPLALVSLTAYAVCDILHGKPIYEAMLANLSAHTDKQKMLLKVDQHEQFEFPIFAGSKLQDRQVKTIAWPKECLLLTIRRGEKEILPHGETLLKAGDTLVILTVPEMQALIKAKLTQLSDLPPN